MFIVTFDEKHYINGTELWIESGRTYVHEDEAKDFVEFLFSEMVADETVRNIKVWNAERILVNCVVSFDK